MIDKNGKTIPECSVCDFLLSDRPLNMFNHKDTCHRCTKGKFDTKGKERWFMTSGVFTSHPNKTVARAQVNCALFSNTKHERESRLAMWKLDQILPEGKTRSM